MRKKNYLGMIELPINIEDMNLFPKTNLHPILFDEVSNLKSETKETTASTNSNHNNS